MSDCDNDMLKIRELSWDTSFFGYKTGRIDIASLSESDIDDALHIAKEEGFKLVYIMDSQQKKITSELLRKYDCSLVDTKVVYYKQLINIVDVNICKKIQFDDDIETIYSLAYESGHYSRFKLDPHFEKNVFERLYRSWIDNSLSGKIADDIFVHKNMDSIAGFVSVKYYKGKSVIGLIAVSENQRAKGIGRSLVQRVEIASLEKGCIQLEVATQRENKQACLFNENNKMKIKELTNIYHAWL